jgi:anaerobic selenocysteine-containing dehydrogenase
MITRRSFLKGTAATVAALALPLAAAPANAAAVDAIKAALAGDFMSAGAAAQQSGDMAAVKLVELIFLRDKGADAGYDRVMAFLNAAPNWPLQETLHKRLRASTMRCWPPGAILRLTPPSRKPSFRNSETHSASRTIARGCGA